ncbi:MAG TPA: J domain-containing protein [Pyrinomonadaceae bacterium]|nr:J domain-containing protein [Pyrinomonadaceae bacterium]
MSTDPGWAYGVLGVKPGVSDRELKAAHRDLAKVWHPDRFLHDPRLQEKAQEKLKEINDAYEQLLSRHTRRSTPPSRRPQPPAAVNVANVRQRRGIGWHWYVAGSFAVFALVFAVTTRSLVRDRVPQPHDTAEGVESTDQQAETLQPDRNHTSRNRPDSNLAAAPEPQTEIAPANEVVGPAVPTVTVAIDPGTGLLATPACPVKTRMTYPSGSEPKGHCNLTHLTKPEKETGIKGLAKRIVN